MASTLHTVVSKTGTDRAVNVEVSEAVPSAKQWELICFTVVLVQGLGQTPQPVLTIKAGSTVIYEALGAGTAQGASSTERYTWGVGLPNSGHLGTTPNIHATAPLPDDLLLSGGWTITTVTLGKGDATNYGAPQILAIEYG